MARRKTRNKTGLSRISDVKPHSAWIGYVCLQCSSMNHVEIGRELLDPEKAFENEIWYCENCEYQHSRSSPLPFKHWPKEFRSSKSIHCERFWIGFFRVCTESPESYWKQCNTCGRILPFASFSKHSGWGPLNRQMECRSCKGAINAKLNPKRTKQQLYESSSRRRIADMLLKEQDERIILKDLFDRFNHCCFKTGKSLDINQRRTWHVDHILPSHYLYPLTVSNAALLSKDANGAKSYRWPSDFYTNHQLIELARITGANLSLLSRKDPLVNEDIDVDACVSRFLIVREGSDLMKRVKDLKDLLDSRGLVSKLSNENRKILGYSGKKR